MKKPLILSFFFLAALGSNADALAHGSAAPKHGGVVRMVGETVIELVVVDGGADIYLREEDQPLPTAGMTGKLTVTLETAKSEAALTPASNNKLQARGVKIPAPSKVSVQVVRADQSRVSATFIIK